MSSEQGFLSDCLLLTPTGNLSKRETNRVDDATPIGFAMLSSTRGNNVTIAGNKDCLTVAAFHSMRSTLGHSGVYKQICIHFITVVILLTVCLSVCVACDCDEGFDHWEILYLGKMVAVGFERSCPGSFDAEANAWEGGVVHQL